jgi:hypothetical protein
LLGVDCCIDDEEELCCCGMDDGDVLCAITENGAAAKAIITAVAIRDWRRQDWLRIGNLLKSCGLLAAEGRWEASRRIASDPRTQWQQAVRESGVAAHSGASHQFSDVVASPMRCSPSVAAAGAAPS